MRAWKILTVVLGFVLVAAAYARANPMVQYTDVVVQSDKALTHDQVKKVILQAASQRRWVASERDSGRIRLSYTHGKLSAIVDVTYSTKKYSIVYVDSSNLNYGTRDGGPSIHPTYNGWVKSLKEGIDLGLKTI